MRVNTITPGELAALYEEGEPVDLIDVRTPVEYREVHVPQARNVPLDRLDPASLLQARNGSAVSPVYFICRSGSRGRQACERFCRAGFSNVVNVEGGTLAWTAGGLPVVRGKKAISLERQVRIVVGSIVLLSSVLGLLLHPAWTGLSAFMGAGLIFSGITDICGLAVILARMPWNQTSVCGTCSSESPDQGASRRSDEATTYS